MRSILCLFACLLALVHTSTALLDQCYNPSQATRLLTQSFESPSEIYSAIKVSKMLNQPLEHSAFTPILTKALKSNDLSEIHAAIGALAKLNQPINVNEQAINQLKTGLQSNNLLMVYHSAQSLQYLIEKKAIKASDVDLSSLSRSIARFEELDHTHRVSLKTEDSSPYFTALTWRMLVAQGDQQAINAALSHASDALKTIVMKNGAIDCSFGLPSHITQPQAIGEMLSALVLLHQSSKQSNAAFPLSGAEIEKFTKYLIDNGATSDIEEIEAIIAGLYAVNQLPSNLQPRVVSMQIDQSNKQSKSLIAVRSVLCEPLSLTEKLTASFNGADLALTKSAAGYSFDQSLNSAAVGEHRISVKLGSSTIELPYYRRCSVEQASASVYVSESSKGEDNKFESIVYPKAFPIALNGDSSKFLHVRVSITSQVQPESVLVMLRRTTSSNPELSSDETPSTSFVCRRVDQHYVARINLGSLEVVEALGGGGEFIVHVLAAHTLYDRSLDWAVADLSLQGAAALSDSSRYGAVKPAIEHTFRTSENRPAYLLPLVFTIAQGVLFAGFVLTLLSRTRLSLPSSPVELSSAFFFQGTLALIIALYCIYWLKLNIFQGLIATFVLSIVALLTGNKALTARNIRKAVKKL